MFVSKKKSTGIVLEGSWEDVLIHSMELRGKRVKVEVLDDSDQIDTHRTPEKTPSLSPQNGKSILDFAGTWVGNDLDDCLEFVISTRSTAKF